MSHQRKNAREPTRLASAMRQLGREVMSLGLDWHVDDLLRLQIALAWHFGACTFDRQNADITTEQ